jgi:hypothetical protein
VLDPVRPVPLVVSERHVTGDAELRVLGCGDSFRSWVDEHTTAPREYGRLRIGDVLRAMITGPRNDLERRVLSEGTAPARRRSRAACARSLT